jgi:predicted nucleic acid-binding Zn ribbon protein
VFKGSGFYKTDNRGSSTKPEKESPGKPAESTPTTSTDTGEATAAAT